MAIKITIDGREVKNPLVRAVLTLLAAILFVVLFGLMLFLLIPLVWIAALILLMAIAGLLAFAPRYINRIRVIQQNRNKQP